MSFEELKKECDILRVDNRLLAFKNDKLQKRVEELENLQLGNYHHFLKNENAELLRQNGDLFVKIKNLENTNNQLRQARENRIEEKRELTTEKERLVRKTTELENRNAELLREREKA